MDQNAAIGIASGWARVGALGSTLRKDYTAIGALIGPLAVALGIGAAFGAMSSYWMFFDKPVFQYPLFALATLGSLANLYTIWHARNLRRRGEGGMIAMTRLELQRTVLVATLSVLTLAVMIRELYLHAMGY